MKRQIVDLMQFIPKLSPGFREPLHLEPMADVFRRIGRGDEVRALVFAPPRHLKTVTAEHACVWLLKQNPALRIGWASYSETPVRRTGRRLLTLLKRARVPLDARVQSATEIATGVGEGGWFGTSVGGASVGLGFDLKIADDPIRNRVDAESPIMRQRTYEWFTDTWGSRGEPGCSDIVMHHKWHTDDLGGRLESDGMYETVRLPAINEAGQPLDPARFDLEALEKKRALIGEYSWWSLWMQQPRGRGSAVFVDVHQYDVRPDGLHKVIGFDGAYTAKTSADHAVALVLGTDGQRWYVIEVVRRQLAAPAFRVVLQELWERHGKPEIVSYIGGQERAILDLFAEHGLNVKAKSASAIGDKFVRAQPAAAAWNAEKILLPRQAPWLAAFVDEVVSFTGVRDRHDDQVDALAAAFDALKASADTDDTPMLVVGGGDRSFGYDRYGDGQPRRDPWLLSMLRARYANR